MCNSKGVYLSYLSQQYALCWYYLLLKDMVIAKRGYFVKISGCVITNYTKSLNLLKGNDSCILIICCAQNTFYYKIYAKIIFITIKILKF